MTARCPAASTGRSSAPTGCRSTASSLSAVIAVILTLPALVKVDINGAPVPVAFFAVVSIGVIGLYVAFAIPIYLRWKAGRQLRAGRLDARRRSTGGCAIVAVGRDRA